MIRPLLIFVFLISSFYSKAQTNLDSLYSIWHDKSQTDSIRTKAYKGYIWDGFLFNKPDSAFVLAEEMVTWAREKQYLPAEAQAYNIQGASYYVQSNYTEALDYYQRSLMIREEMEDQDGIASSLNNIGLIYIRQGNFQQALDYNLRCLKVKEEIGDKKGIALSLNNIGIIYSDQSNLTQALEYYQRSLSLQKEIGDKRGIAGSLNNIGNIYDDQGNYPKALDFYQQSLEATEEINDKRGMTNSLNNIGNIYNEQRDFPQALSFYKRSLKISEDIGDKDGIAMEYANIGSVYRHQGNYPEALENYKRSLKITEDIGNSKELAGCLNGIGNIYKLQGNYQQAMMYYNRSLKISEEIGAKRNIANSLHNIGIIYNYQSRYKAAIIKCLKALKMSEEFGVIAAQKHSCNCLYIANKGLGKNNEALKYHEQLTVLNDSLFNEENTKKLTQLEMQYAFDKQEAATKMEQEKKDVIAAQELKQRKLERNGFIVGFGIMLLFAGVFFLQRNRIGKEKERSDELLLNILPEVIAEELKTKGHSDAQLIDQVTVLFTDFKDFTTLSEKLSPNELVADLHQCFSAFDRICEHYGIEKIKTIGDAYMAAGGLPFPNKTHAKDVVNATLEMAEVVEKIKEEKTALNQAYFEVRIGVHTGPVVAGIVGVKKFQYDIWGDTVNTASRIESNGEAGKVNISQVTYEMLKDDPDFIFENRGKISAKGKGEMNMWFVSKK